MREADVTRSTTAPPGKASEVATNLEATPFSMPHRQEQPSAAGAPDAAPSTGKARLAPKPAVHVEPKRVVPNPEPREAPQPRALITWIDGLAALPVRCPDAKDVEIGVDTRGRPHLIGWDDQLRAISIATGWFNKHRELVRMACPDLDIEDDGEPVVHIFTSEPVRVSDLHGSPLRLHVLAPVEVGGQRGWYAAALNS